MSSGTMAPPARDSKNTVADVTLNTPHQADLHGVFPVSSAPVPRSRKRKATAPLESNAGQEEEALTARDRPPTPFPDCVNVPRSRPGSDSRSGVPSMILASVTRQIDELETGSLKCFADTRASLRRYIQVLAEERESVRSLTADKLVSLCAEAKNSLDLDDRDVDKMIHTFLKIVEGLIGRMGTISEDLKNQRVHRHGIFEQTVREVSDRLDRWSEDAKQYSEEAQQRTNAAYDDCVAQMGRDVALLRAHFDSSKEGLEWIDKAL